MSHAELSPMTSAEFLEWDVRQEKRFEFDGCAPVAMVGGDVAALTVIARTAAGWSLETLRGGETLAMPEIGIEVPVDEFYADVGFA